MHKRPRCLCIGVSGAARGWTDRGAELTESSTTDAVDIGWGVMRKQDQFDSSGEAIGYISLDQAVLRARRLVAENEQRYHDRLGWDEIVWRR